MNENNEKKPGLVKEFVTFINKGNAVALAIGVILGGAFTSIVNSINKDIISPLIGALFGGHDLRAYRTPLWNAEVVIENGVEKIDEYGQVVYTSAIYWGRLIQAVIDFILIGLILFLIMKIVVSVSRKINKAAELAKTRLEGLRNKGSEEKKIEDNINE